MEYGKSKLVELLLTIDEETSLLLGASNWHHPVVIVDGNTFLLNCLVRDPDESMASALSPRRY